jgi:hypothetical protein
MMLIRPGATATVAGGPPKALAKKPAARSRIASRSPPI